MQDSSWIDRQLYPFQPHTLGLDAGEMHYVDEGQGRPVVLVHGAPAWSFLYRELIRGLAPRAHCVAPDLLGFGLSDTPAGWEHTPEAHARSLRALIERLELRDITLVVQGDGGPIGLAYAVEQPRNVRQIVLINTWAWPLEGGPRQQLQAALGGLRYRLPGLAEQTLQLGGARGGAARQVREHYLRPLRSAQTRRAAAAMARQRSASAGWYADLWQRSARLRSTPALVLWGQRDRSLPPDTLDRWRAALFEAQIMAFADAGALLPEDQGAALAPVVGHFLDYGPSQFGQPIVGEAGNFKR
jgi:haloalkane dehalogenase